MFDDTIFLRPFGYHSLEELSCRQEGGNRHNPYAVAVLKGTIVAGHVPRKISAACSLFLRRQGTILCTITGVRQFSNDLPQGGLGSFPMIYHKVDWKCLVS